MSKAESNFVTSCIVAGVCGLTVAGVLNVRPLMQNWIAEFNKPQSLPISGEVDIKGKIFDLEVARTPEEKAKGLMFREWLPGDQGMLFVYDPPEQASFWMKNTLIPLDMIFTKNSKVIYTVENAQPCKSTPCTTFAPPAPVDGVIELNAGWLKKLGLKVGDKVIVSEYGEFDISTSGM
ncbi:DUF192 domain-containing protein [Ancylothrix sp. C2]|uniref:DUF192 domain-containing protein n=1 Tax=Ancylothrix sp. D3o TaxID=2953691 RepID=UPI0021BAB3E9|nr:DUF192 domain-containing protein [Ancylothrix sp. D3o]MCT7952129.1 DUF192 domain-containing protein [Ancylothrix sp. D3o]